MEANQIIIIAVITSIILSIIVGFIVLTIIKHKYPAILTKKIYFESLFNYNINFTPEVIYFITNALTNPALYNISNSVIYNIHNGVGIWTNNNIIDREFYCYYDLNDDIKKCYKDINSKLTMADKYLLEQFTKYINNRLEEYKNNIIYKSNITIADILDSSN